MTTPVQQEVRRGNVAGRLPGTYLSSDLGETVGPNPTFARYARAIKNQGIIALPTVVPTAPIGAAFIIPNVIIGSTGSLMLRFSTRLNQGANGIPSWVPLTSSNLGTSWTSLGEDILIMNAGVDGRYTAEAVLTGLTTNQSIYIGLGVYARSGTGQLLNDAGSGQTSLVAESW